MSVVGSRPGPTLIFPAMSETPATTRSYTDLCAYSRDPAQQHCPWLKKIALAAPAIARSRSASGRMIAGDLPPSSSDTFLRLPAAAWTGPVARRVGSGPADAIRGRVRRRVRFAPGHPDGLGACAIPLPRPPVVKRAGSSAFGAA